MPMCVACTAAARIARRLTPPAAWRRAQAAPVAGAGAPCASRGRRSPSCAPAASPRPCTRGRCRATGRAPPGCAASAPPAWCRRRFLLRGQRPRVAVVQPHTAQRNATRRDATQRNAAQRPPLAPPNAACNCSRARSRARALVPRRARARASSRWPREAPAWPAPSIIIFAGGAEPLLAATPRGPLAHVQRSRAGHSADSLIGPTGG
eukprot:scaffold6326_cov327-Prasinococcus_capsulatus_cf.AAC.4